MTKHLLPFPLCVDAVHRFISHIVSFTTGSSSTNLLKSHCKSLGYSAKQISRWWKLPIKYKLWQGHAKSVLISCLTPAAGTAVFTSSATFSPFIYFCHTFRTTVCCCRLSSKRKRHENYDWVSSLPRMTGHNKWKRTWGGEGRVT